MSDREVCHGGNFAYCRTARIGVTKETCMNIKESVRLAIDNGKLLSVIAETSYDERNNLVQVLSAFHNSGYIDFLSVCRSDQLDAISGRSFFVVQQVFCDTLPGLDCSAADAAATCRILFERAGNDLAADHVFDSLLEWLQKSPEMTYDGLELIRRDAGASPQIVRSILLAGARHDTIRYAEEALDFAIRRQSPARLGAIEALGAMEIQKYQDILPKVIQCLDDAIENPTSENDTVVALRATFGLLNRLKAEQLDTVRPLVLKACKNPNVNTLHEIIRGIHVNRKVYTEEMIDVALAAIQKFHSGVTSIIEEIDFMLYQWDVVLDKQRIMRFLVEIIGDKKHTITFEHFKNFSHKLRTEESGEVLGWFVVSLLLTGEHQLCIAANQLLPRSEIPVGLDIDLSQFLLDGPMTLFLSRKIIGYCYTNVMCTCAMLMSCMRTVSGDRRGELEKTVFKYFLINYPNAIESFRNYISSPSDPARLSVERLSQDVGKYLKRLRQHRLCDAFRPSERERQLQHYRLSDSMDQIQRDASEHSIASKIAHQSLVLYGTGSVYYVYSGDESQLRRQVSSFSSFEQTIEFPRLSVLDPVGLHFATLSLRSEPRPS